jgi:two-component system LytT family response regulator
MIERVVIVDDEPLARERLAALVAREAPGVAVREATDGDAAVELITAWQPHVVLLDVQMPGRDGFDVVATVGAAAMPPTIFVTAYDKHAIRAFDVAAVDYLLKPFDDGRFHDAWTRVVQRSALSALADAAQRLSALLAATPAVPTVGAPATYADRLVVKKNQRTFVVRVADVQWFETKGNYVILHVGKEQHAVRETLGALVTRLDPARFVRIHRRVVVAIDAMLELQPWFGGDQVMLLRDRTQLRVSRSYREALARRLAGLG